MRMSLQRHIGPSVGFGISLRAGRFAFVIAGICVALAASTLWGQNTFPASGNVGIGTTSPTTLLQVGNGTNNFAGFSFNNTSVPQTFFGLEIGTNQTGGQGETNFWNGYPSATRSFDFRQLTGSGTYNTLATILANGNVGIGTTTPSEQFDLVGAEGTTSAINPTLSQGATIALDDTGTGAGSGGAVLFGAYSGAWRFAAIKGYALCGGCGTYSVGDIVFSTRLYPFNAAALSEVMRIQGATGNVGIGTTNPVHPLQVAGIIGAEEVIVSATGADYVFKPDYRLSPLSDVATYIEQNHHLPGIPSAQEVQAQGVNLGEMQTKLLAKIEELTLHMIQAERDNQELRNQNREMQRQTQTLQERISRLEQTQTESARNAQPAKVTP
jgi:hypothetical protein